MKYLYFKLWQTFKKIPTNDMPATNAMIFISMCHFANIFIINLILSLNSFASMKFNLKSEIYAFTVPMCLLIYVLNYLCLYKDRDKVFEKYKDESKRQKFIGNILLVLYIAISFGLVFYLGPKYTLSIAVQ